MGKPVILKTIQEMEYIFEEDPDLMFQIVATAMAMPDEFEEKIQTSNRNRAYRRKKNLEKHKVLEVPPHKLTV